MQQAPQSSKRTIALALRRAGQRLTSTTTPRDNLIGFVAIVGLVVWSVAKQEHYQQPFLQNPLVSFGLVFVAQGLLTIPHELGHAITARLLGLEDIRVIVGHGLPLWSVKIFGFRWLFNKYWIGGWTLYRNSKAPAVWKSFVTTAAGPAVNIAAMFMIWRFFRSGAIWPRIGTLPGIVFWANAMVLLENLVPATFQVGADHCPNDGMKLARFIVHGLISARNRQRILAVSNVAMIALHLLISAIPAIGFLFLSFFFLWKADWTGARQLMRTFALACGICAIPLTYFAVLLSVKKIKGVNTVESGTPADRGRKQLAAQSRPLKDKVVRNTLRQLVHTENAEQKLCVINSLLNQFPDDPYFAFLKGSYLAQCDRHGEAETVFRNAQQLSLPPECHFLMVVAEVECLVANGESKRAKQICELWLAGTAAVDQKVQLLDAFVSAHLYHEKFDDLSELERCERRALSLDARNDSIKATLAGVLVEAGQFDEAEPILIARLKEHLKPEPKAFALFYFGALQAGRGKRNDAKKLINNAMICSRARWLARRAEAKLAQLSSPQ